MSTMTAPAGNVVIPQGRPFTVHDLAAIADDGNRYELIDGMLTVTPAPGWAHQEMGFALGISLRAACPAELRVLLAPFAVRTAVDSEVQPDVIVTRYADLTATNLPVAPFLAVEVASRAPGCTTATRRRRTTSGSVSRRTGCWTRPTRVASPHSNSTRRTGTPRSATSGASRCSTPYARSTSRSCRPGCWTA